MTASTCYIPAETMRNFMVDVFIKSGVPPADAKICSDVLIASDLRGIESHGVGRLRMYFDGIKNGRHSPETHIEVIKDTPTTAVIEGHNGMGHVIGVKCMQMAIEKAHTYGIGAVAVRNSSHFGIDGYYALMAVKEGMIGMAFTNARPSVAPTFSTQPMLGTNPIAFGAPTDEECPFLFDAATSIAQRGKIEVLEREELPTPEGWVIDINGQYPTNTEQILKGFLTQENALLPIGGLGELLGGHKGFGLSVMVEILCASLQSNAYLHHLPGGAGLPVQVGHFFIAINIEHFLPLDEFKHTTGEILRELRAARKSPGHDRIFTAGEKEFLMEKEIAQKGIPVIPNLQKDLNFLKNELGLDQYHFPF